MFHKEHQLLIHLLLLHHLIIYFNPIFYSKCRWLIWYIVEHDYYYYYYYYYYHYYYYYSDISLLHYYTNLRSSIIFCLSSADVYLSLSISLSSLIFSGSVVTGSKPLCDKVLNTFMILQHFYGHSSY